MKFKQNGFTLIELLVVIVIAVMLLSIAIPLYSKWLKKENVVKDTKKIFSELNYLKLKSFTTKNQYALCWDSNPFNSVIIKKNGVSVYSINLRNKFKAMVGISTCIDFSTFGTADHLGSIVIDGNDYGANVDCVKISRIRIDMGKWNGEECELQ